MPHNAVYFEPFYERLKTTTCSERALNALAIDEPLEYARLYLEGNMQMWVDAEDSLELWQIILKPTQAPNDL